MASTPLWKEITFLSKATPGNFQRGINSREKSCLVFYLCNETYSRHFQAFNILECVKFHSWLQVHNCYMPPSLGRRHAMLEFHRAAWLTRSPKLSGSKTPLAILTTQE